MRDCSPSFREWLIEAIRSYLFMEILAYLRSQRLSPEDPGHPCQLPNNLTGRVCPAASLATLGELLKEKSRETGRLSTSSPTSPTGRSSTQVQVPPSGGLRQHTRRLELLKRAVAGRRADRIHSR
jgi:hypothetical protein